LDELLKYMVDSGRLRMCLSTDEDLFEVENQFYLSKHNHKIWQTSDGKFCTYVYENGKRRLIRKKYRADLDKFLVEREREKAGLPTFEDMFNAWITRKIEYREIKDGTKDRYINEYGKHLKDVIGSCYIEDITEEMLDDLCRDTIKDEKMTSKAYSNMRTIIIGTMKYAKRNKFTEIDITQFFHNLDISRKCFSKSEKKLQIFEDYEVKRISEYINENKTVGRLGILLCFQTGLREGELCGIKYEDIKDRYIHICRQEIKYKAKEKGKLIHEIVDYTKTEAGERDVILTPNAIRTIEEIRKLNPNGEYLMQNPDGSKLQTNSFNGFLYRMCDELKIPRRSMHKIRKTYATALIDADVEDSITMNQLGHSDIGTTRKYYYFSTRSIDKKYDKIVGAISF